MSHPPSSSHRWPARLVLAALVAALSACGGGSGPGPASGDSPPAGGLSIVSSTPAEGASGVDRGVRPELALSGDTTPDAVRMTCADLPVPADIAVDGMQVRITPAQRLLPLARCKVRVGDGPAIAFTTADGAWAAAAQAVENGSANAQQVDVAMDAQGNAIAVWQADGVKGNDIVAARYQPGSGWGEPTTIGGGFAPHVTVDAAGHAIAAWIGGDGDAIHLRRFVPQTGWAASDRVSNGAPVSLVRIAGNAAGDAVVVWLGQDDGAARYSIYAKRYVPAQGWAQSQPLESADLQAYDAVAALGPDGTATVLWLQSDGNVFNALASRSGRTGGWSAPAIVDAAAAASVGNPVLAASQDGSVMAGWTQWSGSFIELWASRFTAETGWQPPARVDQATRGVGEPHLAMDARGGAVAVWVQNEAAGRSVASSRFRPDGGWEAAAPVGTFPGEPQGPRVAVDAAGNALVAWQQLDGTGRTTYANRRPAGGPWASPTPIGGAPSVDANRPALAMGPTGSAIAAWDTFDGETRYRIVFNRFD